MASELRCDPFTRTWVLICEERAKRPRGSGPQKCPFCPGNENETPPEIFRLQTKNNGWKTRVVPNKFNALSIEAELNRMGLGVYIRDGGFGAHEVIVDHPHEDHRHPAELNKQEWVDILRTGQMRMIDLKKDGRFKYPVFFKNQGKAAGMSIEHPHCQLMVLPIVPPRIERTLGVCKEYYDKNKHCMMCRIINDESGTGERIVSQNNSMVAWSPYASRSPYELWIAPKPEFHSHSFETDEEDRLGEIAELFIDVLQKLKVAADNPDFNIILFTAPWIGAGPQNGATIERDFHWHFQIIPQTTKLAGFEWGTGFYINIKSPELAAEEMRKT